MDNNYFLLTVIGIIFIILAYAFGYCVGYKKSEDEIVRWIDHINAVHEQQEEDRVNDMYKEHLAEEEDK